MLFLLLIFVGVHSFRGGLAINLACNWKKKVFPLFIFVGVHDFGTGFVEFGFGGSFVSVICVRILSFPLFFFFVFYLPSNHLIRTLKICGTGNNRPITLYVFLHVLLSRYSLSFFLAAEFSLILDIFRV